MTTTYDRAREDVSNIVHLEHVNVTQPDQRLATLFYVSGLGFTRDPYLMVGLENMWINIGRSQMHLPTNRPQRMRGTIGLVVPDLTLLKQRLARVAPALEATEFTFVDRGASVDVTCPWGNRFRCHAPAPEFGETELAMPYVELDVAAGSAEGIARFYAEIMEATTEIVTRDGACTAAVTAGRDQHLFFRETTQPLPAYDGHHVQIYIADFSGPYRRLLRTQPRHAGCRCARVAFPRYRRHAYEPDAVHRGARGAQPQASAVRPAAGESQPGADQPTVRARSGFVPRDLLATRRCPSAERRSLTRGGYFLLSPLAELTPRLPKSARTCAPRGMRACCQG